MTGTAMAKPFVPILSIRPIVDQLKNECRGSDARMLDSTTGRTQARSVFRHAHQRDSAAIKRLRHPSGSILNCMRLFAVALCNEGFERHPDVRKL